MIAKWGHLLVELATETAWNYLVSPLAIMVRFNSQLYSRKCIRYDWYRARVLLFFSACQHSDSLGVNNLVEWHTYLPYRIPSFQVPTAY